MAALLPALWMIQEDRGWISEGAMAEVGQVLSLTPAYVKGVVTFYTMYHQHPVGKALHPGVHDVAMQRLRREDVVQALLKHTKCGELGVTSDDGRFTVIEVECPRRVRVRDAGDDQLRLHRVRDAREGS
jgi:NADH:ubiquinone oxidoreductase subunit E